MTLEILLIVTALMLLALIFDALRRRRLTEGYAMLWAAAGLATVLLAIGRPLIDAISSAIGIAYGPTLVFAAAGVFLAVVCLSLSMQVTRLRKQVEALAQEIALRSAGGGMPTVGIDEGDDDAID